MTEKPATNAQIDRWVRWLEACKDSPRLLTGGAPKLTRLSLIERIKQEQADQREIVGLLQRCLQPPGSPPPGGAMILAPWIIRSAATEISSLRGLLRDIEACEPSMAGFDKIQAIASSAIKAEPPLALSDDHHR